MRMTINIKTKNISKYISIIMGYKVIINYIKKKTEEVEPSMRLWECGHYSGREMGAVCNSK